MIYFQSERLHFRDWNEDDLPVFIEMNKDPLVMKYFPKELSDEETHSFYQRIQDEFSTSGYGLYAVEVKETKEFIGYIGFHKAAFLSFFTPCIEVGWRLSSKAWGKGYATEGAKACLDYGFSRLDLDKIFSFTAAVNLPSERVMQKIGMKKETEFNHPDVSEDSPLSKHVLYSISKVK